MRLGAGWVQANVVLIYSYARANKNSQTAVGEGPVLCYRNTVRSYGTGLCLLSLGDFIQYVYRSQPPTPPSSGTTPHTPLNILRYTLFSGEAAVCNWE